MLSIAAIEVASGATREAGALRINDAIAILEALARAEKLGPDQQTWLEEARRLRKSLRR